MDHQTDFQNAITQAIDEDNVEQLREQCETGYLMPHRWQEMARCAVEAGSLQTLKYLLEVSGTEILQKPQVVEDLSDGISRHLGERDEEVQGVLEEMLKHRAFPGKALWRALFTRGDRGGRPILDWLLEEGIPENLAWMQKGRKLSLAVKRWMPGLAGKDFTCLERVLDELGQSDPQIIEEVKNDATLRGEIWVAFINLKHGQSPDKLLDLGVWPPPTMPSKAQYEFSGTNPCKYMVGGWLMTIDNSISWAPNLTGNEMLKQRLYARPEHRAQLNLDLRNNQAHFLDINDRPSDFIKGQMVEAGFDFDGAVDLDGNTFFHRLFDGAGSLIDVIRIPETLQAWIETHPEHLLDKVSKWGENCFGQEGHGRLRVKIVAMKNGRTIKMEEKEGGPGISLDQYQSNLKKLALEKAIGVARDGDGPGKDKCRI